MIYIGIPARMGSSRFPGKPLALINGIPMIHHIYMNCVAATMHLGTKHPISKNTKVFIATPDEEIENYCLNNDINCIHTEQNIQRPCLRVFAAVGNKINAHNDLVVVVQGDEPTISPLTIADFINAAMIVNSTTSFKKEQIYNAYSSTTKFQANDPNEIKVVLNVKGEAIYFSRNVIPSNYHSENEPFYHKQICIYAYNKAGMEFMMRTSADMLELAESIEMIKPIEHGINPMMFAIPEENHSVDVKEDIPIVEEILRERGK